MAENNKNAEKSIREQVADLLQRKPQNYDVIFSVGPQKTKVEAVKILLKAASPVFEREFDENWENAVVQEGEGIPLPHFEPNTFKLFVGLIISDTWSVDAIKKLNLPESIVMSLLGLCRRYKIRKAIESLEIAVENIIQNFYKFKDTVEFLKISQENLETILSCDQILLDERGIFDAVCRWAEHQCKQKKLEPTGENFREVLGSGFFEIRFPTMKLEDFTKLSLVKKNLFTADERLAVYDFIGTDESEKVKFDKLQLPFETKPRTSGLSVLRLPKQFKILENPPFMCNGSVVLNHFQVNTKVLLHGIGFLGPIDGDTHFEVTVEIQKRISGLDKSIFGLLKKNIFARKGKCFYFLFDSPIIIEPTACDNSFGQNCYRIDFSLKGASNVPQFKGDHLKDEFVQISDVQFNLYRMWNSGRCLAELLFKKIK